MCFAVLDQAPGKAPGLRARWRTHHPGTWLFPLDRLGEVGETGDCTAVQTTSGQLPSQLPSLGIGVPDLQYLCVELWGPFGRDAPKGSIRDYGGVTRF